MSESLQFKWGTLKGWDLKSDKSRELLRRYMNLGFSLSAMAQRDTPEQKKVLCDLIDAIDGEIENDWSDEVISKEEAKQYIMTYGAGQ